MTAGSTPITAIVLELSPLSNVPLFRVAQTRRKGQYKADLTLLPCLHVKPLITAIRPIGIVPRLHNLFDFPTQRPFPSDIQHVVIHFIVAPCRHSAFSSLSRVRALGGLIHLQTPLGLPRLQTYEILSSPGLFDSCSAATTK